MKLSGQLLRLCTHGLFVSICFIVLFSYATDMSMKVKARRMHQRQEERRQQINKTCNSNKQRFFEEPNPDLLNHLLVDDEHCLIYCYVPKVACSNLKKIMVTLKSGPPYGDPSILTTTVHDSQNLTFLKDLPKHEITAKLKHYTKFVFVRDPFVRLISAYRNKIEVPQGYFYGRYGRNILRLYGNQSNPPADFELARASKLKVSFDNFIQYLLDPQTEGKSDDEHWKQMNKVCFPCHIQYDFIGHQEDMNEDSEDLLEMLKLKNEIRVPQSPVIRTSYESLAQWYTTLPLSTRRKLYKRYEMDFELFGYSRPDGLLES
ncbi:carbohydrate sulfotransferase 12-like [Solea solea]|uniref:carbohydrate sulfotransferase 12-like n=1 Tax=Solea solea TaxID=90069 RepID=UPI00272AD4ED|nr:carbohydrate sulfotransferase 12-like [Solea solea]